MTDLATAAPPTPIARRRHGLRLTGAGVGLIALGGAIAWFASRAAEGPLEARTRARLAPPRPPRGVPNAADIHVG